MNSSAGKTLFRRLEARGFRPRHVAEVGVHNPESSNVRDWLALGTRGTLVEPDPDAAARIRSVYAGFSEVVLHQVAITENGGTARLVRRNASTFLSEIEAPPAVTNDGLQRGCDILLTVNAATFDQVDDGTIDLLSIDVEGAEWFVINRLVSRPAVISVETHGSAYLNPRIDEISAWMSRAGYRVWYVDRSDTVYVLPNRVAVRAADVLLRLVVKALLDVRRRRKRLLILLASKLSRRTSRDRHSQ
ncbi:MAG: FkbM family methyltransferase [Gemmatimonadota bacterium]